MAALNKLNSNLLIQVCSVIEESRRVIESTYEAFLKLRLGILDENEKKTKEILKTINNLADKIAQEQPTSEFISILGHLEVIRENHLKIVNLVRRKNKDRVLFSEKAVKELREIFGAVNGLLLHVNDLIVTKNPAISTFLATRYKEISGMISEYGTEHEDRLVRGVCLPQSSIIYLLILDAFNGVLVHINGINKCLMDQTESEN